MENKLKTMFAKDGAEMIETLDFVVSRLEERKFDQELLDQAFRTVHSLKSETSFLGHSALTETTSRLEDLFDVWRKRKGALKNDELNELLNAMHDLKQQFRSVNPESGDVALPQSQVPANRGGSGRTGIPATKGSEVGNEKNQISKAKTAVPDPDFGIHATTFQRQLLRESKGRSELLYRLDCEIDSAEPMAYARLYLVISNLEQSVHVIKYLPGYRNNSSGSEQFSSGSRCFWRTRRAHPARGQRGSDQESEASAARIRTRCSEAATQISMSIRDEGRPFGLFR